MKNLWKEIPVIYQYSLALIAIVVFGLKYHDGFVTIAQAEEAKRATDEQMLLIRVDGKQKEKRTLTREKAKAVKMKDVADATALQLDTDKLGEEIKYLCAKTDKCYQGGG